MTSCKSEGCNNTTRKTSRGSRFCGPCIMSKFRYGISIPERDSLLFSQSGKCKICSRQISFDGTAGSKDSTANIDHDHSTKKVRGILCWPCNTALGKFNDNVETLMSAINYLQGKETTTNEST